MFKNLLFFKITADWDRIDQSAVEQAARRHAFEPCTATQELSYGWVSPRKEDHSPLLEAINGHWLLKLHTESKSVPGSVLNAELERRCQDIERSRGFKPGRKEKKELKDELRLELLPRAFSKHGSCWVWIDRVNGTLVVSTSSRKMSDSVLDQLTKTFELTGNIPTLEPVFTAESPATAMAAWLVNQEAPADFTIDRECELKQTDGEGATVRYSKHSLELEEIARHINEGKRPTRLAMTFNSRVSFILAEDLSIRKVEFLDDIFVETEEKSGFDGDVVIATTELSALIPAVVQALGGEAKPGAETPAEAGQPDTREELKDADA